MKKKIFKVCVFMAVAATMCISGCNKTDIKNNTFEKADSTFTTKSTAVDVDALVNETVNNQKAESTTAAELPKLSERPFVLEEGEDPYALKANYARSDRYITEKGQLSGLGGLSFTSLETGEETSVCFYEGCLHNEGKWGVYGKPQCMASIYTNMASCMYSNNAIYFFVGGSAFRIIKMDLNTGERTMLADFAYEPVIASSIHINGDYVYYLTTATKKEAVFWEGKYMGDSNVRCYSVIEVSLVDGSYRFLTEWRSGEMSFDIAGNTLYAKLKDKDGYEYDAAVDICTLEQINLSRNEWYSYLAPYDGNSYFYYDNVSYEIGIMNTDGKVEERLIKGAEGETFEGTTFSQGGIIYKRTLTYMDEEPGTYFYDMETGESTDITEEVEKYWIEYYDAQFEVFKGYIILTKDEVLSEARSR